MPGPRRRRRLLGWLATATWAGLIFWQSGTADVGGLLGSLPPGSDKVGHFAAFAWLAAMLTLATERPLLAAALATLYGATDEVHQAFVPGRWSDPLDLLADALGAAVGAWLVGRALGRRRRPRRGT